MTLQIPLAFLKERSGEAGSVHSYKSPLGLCALNVLYRRSPSLPPRSHVPGINDCSVPEVQELNHSHLNTYQPLKRQVVHQMPITLCSQKIHYLQALLFAMTH